MADNLAPIADGVFGRAGPVEGITALLGVYAFAFQILGDFAGYSFIAMGIAKLLGIELSTNFLFPYFVTNPRDFWRNWHITLSTWLRDYLYIPLGGNRGTTARVARNLMATMLLGGLWHGAAWTFVVWGAYQGALLIGHRGIESIVRRRRGEREPPGGAAWVAVKVVAMFHLTCLGWLIFRANSVTQVRDLLLGMLAHFEMPTQAVVLTFERLVFYAGLTLAVQWLQRRSGEVTSIAGIPGILRVPLAAAMVYALLAWGNYGGSEFIYFQF
jgi:D-alanyl-lipoteichoic acid acyltransferase DltB (MBOAT superfamily)